MSRIVSFLVRGFVRWMPDAFVVALLLTLLTFGLAIGVAGYDPKAAVEAWGDGFWNLLTFTNQITLTLLLGYAFANTPPVRKLLMAIAGAASTPLRAYALASFVSGVAALLSWGLSLIAAGIMSRAIGERCREQGIRIHYPLLVASAFSGFVIWHQGLSSSVGLAIATPGHFLEDAIGLIPTSETLFTAWNLALALGVLVTLPFVMASLRPREEEEIQEMPEGLLTAPEEVSDEPRPETPAERIERSRFLTGLIVAVGALFIGIHYIGRGRGLDLNILNFTFLMAGMLLAGSPIAFMRIILEGGRIAVPFLLQYPFYSAIAGLMRDSGMAQIIVDFFVSIATAETLPLFGLLSGGLLNLFIPSGGGQWAVQGPIMMGAAEALGADLPRVAMSVALGDQWTNLVQPLAIVPVLAIAGLGVRDIMGYTLIALLYTGAVFATALLL